jgi:hypothetical protein
MLDDQGGKLSFDQVTVTTVLTKYHIGQIPVGKFIFSQKLLSLVYVY